MLIKIGNRSNYYKIIFEKSGKPDNKIQSQLLRVIQQKSVVIVDSQNSDEIQNIRHNLFTI